MKKILAGLIYVSLRVYRHVSKLSLNILWKSKINKLINSKNPDKLNKNQKSEIKSFYHNHQINNISTLWHQFYSIGNSGFSAAYVPENLFYLEIEPMLNRPIFTDALSDKNLLHRLFTNVVQPQTILKNINGFYYSGDEIISLKEAIELCKGSDQMIIKPTIETGGGKNVIVFECINGRPNTEHDSIEILLKSYKKDFIVQRKVKQHRLMAQFNASSLNTFRTMTYLNDGEVSFLSTVVRMGMKGAVTDNSSGGGISCGVKADGSLNEFGFKFSGEHFSKTSEGIPFSDIALPFMPLIEETTTKLHKCVPYFKIISWDLSVDDSGNLVLIEYNVKGQDITFHQLNNGPVLSGLLQELGD